MTRFSPVAISIRALLPTGVVVAVAAFLAGWQSRPASVVSSFPMCSAETEAAHSAEAAYLTENDAAMSKMMSGMTIKPTGDVDLDFVAMMTPHHQGAIDMAQAVLRNGRNEQIRRLAQEIIVTQQQEIAAMRLAIGDPLPPSVAAPTQVSAASTGFFTVPFVTRRAGESQ